MIINDRVYGIVKIESPVLLELIKSEPIQRLKGISQFGIPDEFYYLKSFSRYEHSIGVMILLKYLAASEKEQIAGLLHDVSHTAFSHVIDFVVGEEKTENFQDKHHKNFIKSSSLTKILKKYNYDFKEISQYKQFGLLERKIPMLCADRVDYSLREFPKTVSKNCFKELTTSNGFIVFKNKTAAYSFAKNFILRQTNHWGGFEASVRYRLFANILQYALEKKIIKFEDFWKNDLFVVNKLKKSQDKKILKELFVLRKKSLKNMPKSKKIAYKKFRYVDPFFMKRNKLSTLSESSKLFKVELKNARDKNLKGSVVPLI